MNNLDMTLRDLMRAQDVTRWQIVRCGKAQSIAEHSWAVGVIAQKLWLQASGGRIGESATDVELMQLANAALWHDAPEVFTGDINTPTKTFLKVCTEGLDNSLIELENTAGHHFRWACLPAGTPLATCLKLADYLEALYFLHEYGQGSYAKDQAADLMRRMMNFATVLSVQSHINWREAVIVVAEQLIDGKETTSFQRVEALLGQNT